MKIRGNLIIDGIGKKRLDNAFISPTRTRQYIVSDWNYEDVFVDCLDYNKIKQLDNIDVQQFFVKINKYIDFSKKHKRLPTVNRIIDFFDKKIDRYIANRILQYIVVKKQKDFEYDMPILADSLYDVQNVNVILVSKQLLIKMIRNKNINYKFGCMYFNNIRIVENKLNLYNIMVLTNENKLRVVMLKMELF